MTAEAGNSERVCQKSRFDTPSCIWGKEKSAVGMGVYLLNGIVSMQ